MSTEEFNQFLRDNYLSMTNSELAKATNKTVNSIGGALHRLGLKRPKQQQLVLLPGEEFRSLEEMGPNYQVSNKGRIKNKDNKIMNTFDSHGYRRITLSPEPNVKKKFLVHVLVAKAFIPNPDNKPFVDHKDMDKTNNCVENLEWVTQSENEQRKMDKKPELKNHLSKLYSDDSYRDLIEKDIKEICESINAGLSNSEIAEKHGVDINKVSAIRTKRLWKSIGDLYF